MTWPALVMYAVVLLVGVPAMVRNPTAFGLVISWSIAEGLWYMTGDNLPLDFYFIADLTVIAIVYAKTISARPGKVYASGWHQLKCMVTDLTRCDRAIVALFLFGAWPVYVLNIGAWEKWFLLWAVTILQFLIAGYEAASDLIASRAANAGSRKPDIPSPGEYRWAHGTAGYG